MIDGQTEIDSYNFVSTTYIHNGIVSHCRFIDSVFREWINHYFIDDMSEIDFWGYWLVLE